jgi:hypothetical protein
MATKAEVLDDPVVGGAKGAKHEAHLQCRINEDAPHFEIGKYVGESGFERDDRLGVGLFDVNKVEDVAEGVNRARGVKILIDMRDHFEPLAVKPGFLDEEVGDWGLDVVVDNLLPPSAGDGVGICREEKFGVGTGAEWRTTKSGVDDFLGFNPRIFVGDILEP